MSLTELLAMQDELRIIVAKSPEPEIVTSALKLIEWLDGIRERRERQVQADLEADKPTD